MNTSPVYQPSLIRAIIGLGNPGRQYERTRHNIGFMMLDALAQQHGASWQQQANAMTATIRIIDQKVLLLKPLTFMNNSGAVTPLLKKQGITVDQLLVVHDELEMSFGKLAIRLGGSARGHNGLRSLIAHLGPEFWRLRVGIDRPEHKEEVATYVLAPFVATEMATMPDLLQRAISLVLG